MRLLACCNCQQPDPTLHLPQVGGQLLNLCAPGLHSSFLMAGAAASDMLSFTATALLYQHAQDGESILPLLANMETKA